MASVSVLIRNRNEGPELRLVLERLSRQRTPAQQIVVVDNQSTDDSRAVISEFGATLVHVPVGEFTYGRATNIGFAHATGELVLMLSAHSIPVGRNFIDDVTAPFTDPRVAAVRIPIAANTRELRNVTTLAVLDATTPPAEVFRRGPAASGSVIRRAVWEQFPVDDRLEAAEDKEWALRVLQHGDWIMLTVDACYVYTKSYTTDTWIRKLQREERAGLSAAGVRRPPDWMHVAKTVAAGLRDVWRQARTDAAIYRIRRRSR